MPPPRRGKAALVLAGGSARGAYEVGVVDYLLKDVARALGREVPIDILCGTSAGAINACMLAAHADDPRGRADRLAERWTGLHIETVIRPSTREIFSMLGGLIGKRREPALPGAARRGGLLDPSGIEDLVRVAIPFDRIGDHLKAGLLSALTVSTTHISSGRTVVFVQRAEPGVPRWSRDPTMSARAAVITADHALASASVPLIFPAVRLDDEYYCDGGLRQNVPLSPARRLGADGLIVVNPRFVDPAPLARAKTPEDEPRTLDLLGKTLNALLLDRIDNDIDRLNRINAILESGQRHYGPPFLSAINEDLGGKRSGGLRPLRVVHVRASEDIGALAAAYVASPEFKARAPGWIGRLLRRAGEGAGESDLVSYVLFDGGFAAQLIEMGRKDAAARHEDLCAFMEALG